ncbi:aspartic peptidase domain-containing protein [Pilobolus umbonatus]|nr:aspartic peptidase domain-containing protein [Pilobolus umbonatus]
MRHMITYSLLFLLSGVSASEDFIRLPIKKNLKTKSVHSKRMDYKEPLYNKEGIEYLIEIGVGTPPQKFHIAFDTGSADIWIPSTACPVAMCPLKRFNSAKSSTFHALNQTFSVEYGIGSATGVYAKESISFPKSGVSLPGHTIALATKSNNIIFESYDNSPTSNGVFGLGFPDISTKATDKPSHFVADLFNAGMISAPIFSIFLNTQFLYGTAGELVLGGIDPARYTGEISYVPVITYDVSMFYIVPNLGVNATTTETGSKEEYIYWAVPGQGISTSAGYKFNHPELVAYIVDSGNTISYFPPLIVKNIVMSATNKSKTTAYDAINEIYTVDCAFAQSDPSNVVEIHMSSSAVDKSATSVTITVPVSDLIIPIDEAINAETSNLCMFGIAPTPTGLDLSSGDVWILGQSVLRSVYSVFDLNEHRVGIAKAQYVADTPVTGVKDVDETEDNTNNDAIYYDVNTNHAPQLPITHSISCLMLIIILIWIY